jgi:hypothetical protein
MSASRSHQRLRRSIELEPTNNRGTELTALLSDHLADGRHSFESSRAALPLLQAVSWVWGTYHGWYLSSWSLKRLHDRAPLPLRGGRSFSVPGGVPQWTCGVGALVGLGVMEGEHTNAEPVDLSS